MQLRDYQQKAVDDIRNAYRGGFRSPLLVAPTGSGKCLAKGTPVLLYSGHIIPVEDVRVGDYLMGPDSQPRRVKSVCAGFEDMFKVTPNKGEPFACNKSHILSLKRTQTNEVVNISVGDYIKKSNNFKHLHKLWRVGVNFNTELPLIMPPYILGLWLGDGRYDLPMITTGDAEIKSEWVNYGLQNNCEIRYEPNSENSENIYLVRGRAGRLGGWFNNMMKSLGIYKNKHIPHTYKTSSEFNRLEILAGIIDTDGYHDGVGGFQIVQKNKRLSEDIVFIARSLGFLATIRQVEKKCHNNGKIGVYYSINISGDTDRIRCRIKRKQAPRRKINKNPLMHGFTLEPMGVGQYFGFEIDGPDRLFLLGDFTVTHNTVIFCFVAGNAIAKGNKVLILAHRRELIRQAVIKLRANGLTPGVIAPGFDFNRTAGVQVASVQTLVRRLNMPWRPDLIVVDECHHASSKTYTTILEAYPSARVLGVTATPCRQDGKGLGDLFDEMVLGPSMRDLIDMGHLSDYDIYIPPGGFDGNAHMRMGDYITSEIETAMSTPKITGDAVAHYRKICSGAPAVVFCTSVRHAEYVALAFQRAGYRFMALSGHTAGHEREEAIASLGDGRLHGIASCDIISEGTDIPVVTAAILLRPTMSEGLYLQQVGRVLRPAAGKEKAIILDHAGNVYRHGLPDDDRGWALHRTPPKKEKKKKSDLAIKICEFCYAANKSTNRVCAKCGQVFTVKRKGPDEVDGELVKVDGSIKRKGKQPDPEKWSARSLQDLIVIAKKRGYKLGWAYVEAKRRGLK